MIPLAPIPGETDSVVIVHAGTGRFLEDFTPHYAEGEKPDHTYVLSRSPEITWSYRDARTIVGLAVQQGWFFIASEIKPVPHPDLPGRSYHPPIYTGIHQ